MHTSYVIALGGGIALGHIRMQIHVNSISGMHVIQKPYVIPLR